MIHLPLKVTEFCEIGGLIRVKVEFKFSQQLRVSVFNQLSYKLGLLKQPILLQPPVFTLISSTICFCNGLQMKMHFRLETLFFVQMVADLMKICAGKSVV